MSKWKNHAHLFANGKFDLEHSDKHGNGGNYDAKDWGVHDGEIVAFYETVRKDTATYPLTDQCKLIARPISDMTDEETRSLAWSVKQIKNSIKNPELGDIPSGDLLHLLSIGVYPFDDDTDVIFKPKTEQP